MSTDYPIDRELLAWLAERPAIPPIASVEIVHLMRAGMTQLLTENPSMIPRYTPGRPIDEWHEHVPGPAGAPDVRVRIFAPEDRNGPLPGLLHIHGGGFVIGSADMSDIGKRYADEVGAVVVSVDYRLAPEHPFPAPVEDCYAALAWFAAKAEDLGVDPARIGITGESAGGGLAAGTTLLARDRGGPALCYQHLDIPELDDRLDTPSMTEYVDTPLWNRPSAQFSWRSYLGEVTLDGSEVSPYAAPARARDLSGLPPTTVTVCQFDPLRDEGIAYAQKLMAANVPTELHAYPATFHGSAGAAEAAVTKRMLADNIASLRRGLKVTVK